MRTLPTNLVHRVLAALCWTAWVALPFGPAAAAEPAPEPRAERPLGLWVLAEGSQRVLEHPARIPALLADAKALGATDLFVQVYRRGVAWWPSSATGPAESFVAARIAAGEEAQDPFADLLAAAHDEGLKIHAWMNILSLADNAEAAIVQALGPGVLQVDRKGRSILEYPEGEMPEPEAAYMRMGTPAVWVDPAAPGVADWYGALVAELFARYPSLDGLHIDYLRYPDVLPSTPGSRFNVGMDFGYGEASRMRFQAATGLEVPVGSTVTNAAEWDDWRRQQVTGLLRRLRAEAQQVSPRAALSAAVFAWPDRAYLSIYQDWFGWLEAGLLDFAVPMIYTRDDRLLRYRAAAFAGGIARERVWAGLGAWLFVQAPERAVAQLREVDRLGVAGRALFSWDSIAEAPALKSALAEEAARSAAQPARAAEGAARDAEGVARAVGP